MNADNYESDLGAAVELVAASVDLSQCDGNMRNWTQDALNDSWDESLTIEQWAAPVIARFRDE